jgi:hypothetical protein
MGLGRTVDDCRYTRGYTRRSRAHVVVVLTPMDVGTGLRDNRCIQTAWRIINGQTYRARWSLEAQSQ